MLADPDVAAGAALFAEPARAAIHAALMGDRALPATELAAAARVAPSTASFHLARLVEAGLLAVERHGRHRYYRLADERAARVVEALALVAPQRRARGLREARVGEALRAARTCYDHVAGRVGVGVTDALRADGVLTADFALGPNAERWLERFGLELPSRSRRPLARACLDWSERRPHVAGALGAALATALVQRRWLQRSGESRALKVTAAGRRALQREFALRV